MIPLPVARTKSELRAQTALWRASGEPIALVPTMGALHEGHLSLVALARRRAVRVITSIFVNPTQFAPDEDFDAYPRDEAADRARLSSAGTDLLYAPTADQIYPAGFSTTITVSGVTEPLEGAARPSHFAGVATVVAKLLIQASPDVAVFGEKDYQQLQLIRRLALDLDLPVEILGAPIIRANDGLALSSRNAYLSQTERRTAARLNLVLAEAARALGAGATVGDAESAAVRALESAGFDSIDYLEVRAADDLRRLGPGPVDAAARVLAAVRIGRTRLIDNMAV